MNRSVQLIPVAGCAGAIEMRSDDVYGCYEIYLDKTTGALFLEFSHGGVLKLVAHGEAFKVYQWRPPEYAPIVLAGAEDAYTVTGEFDWVRTWRQWLPTDDEIIERIGKAFPGAKSERFDDDVHELDQWYNRQATAFRRDRLGKTAARQEAAR